MQQSVQPAEVDKRPVLGQVLHGARQHRSFFKVFQGGGFLYRILFIQYLLAGDHNIAALLV